MIDIDKATKVEVFAQGNGADIVCQLKLTTAQFVDFSYGVPKEEIERNLKKTLMYNIYGDLIRDISLLKYEHLKDIPYNGKSYNEIARKFDALIHKLEGAL